MTRGFFNNLHSRPLHSASSNQKIQNYQIRTIFLISFPYSSSPFPYSLSAKLEKSKAFSPGSISGKLHLSLVSSVHLLSASPLSRRRGFHRRRTLLLLSHRLIKEVAMDHIIVYGLVDKHVKKTV
ncbi:hypothetical protein Dimus_037750 [Dionaea muscipula]